MVDGCLHDGGILLLHHEAVELAEMRGRDFTLQIIVVDDIQERIACQVVASCDKSLGQDSRIVIIERKDAIALTVVVGNDITGFATLQTVGHDRFLHVDGNGTAW